MARVIAAAQRQRMLREFADAIDAGWSSWTPNEGTLIPLIERIWPAGQTDPYFEKIDDVCAFVSTVPVGYAGFPSRNDLLRRLEREERGIAAKERDQRNDKAINGICNVAGVTFAVVFAIAIGMLFLHIMTNK